MGAATFLPPAAILSLTWFTLINSITPGPNNILLAASGVNFGVRASYPQMAGIFTGIVLVTLATGLGLGAIFDGLSGGARCDAHSGLCLHPLFRLAHRPSGSLSSGELAQPMSFATGARSSRPISSSG